MQRNPHSYQIATGYRTFYSLSLIYQPITKKRLFLFKKLKVREQEYLIPLIEEFKKEMPPFTATEVRNYFCNLNKNWEQVFNLLNSSTLTRLSLSILGLYIGTKIIGKLTHSSPLSISNFNKYIQI